MGIQVSNLRKDEKTFTFTKGDDSAEITYRPSAVTPKSMSKVRETDPNEGDLAVVHLLAGNPDEDVHGVLVRWDVMDGDEMWPITVERVSELPLGFLADVLKAIQDDMVGESGKG